MLERFDTGQFFKIRLSAAATSTRHWQPKAAASATHNLLPIRKYKEKTHPTDITFFEFARGTGRNRRVANCGPTSPKSGGAEGRLSIARTDFGEIGLRFYVTLTVQIKISQNFRFGWTDAVLPEWYCWSVPIRA